MPASSLPRILLQADVTDQRWKSSRYYGRTPYIRRHMLGNKVLAYPELSIYPAFCSLHFLSRGLDPLPGAGSPGTFKSASISDGRFRQQDTGPYPCPAPDGPLLRRRTLYQASGSHGWQDDPSSGIPVSSCPRATPETESRTHSSTAMTTMSSSRDNHGDG